MSAPPKIHRRRPEDLPEAETVIHLTKRSPQKSMRNIKDEDMELSDYIEPIEPDSMISIGINMYQDELW